MLESCKLPEVRAALGQLFLRATTQRRLEDRDCFKVLGWVCQEFLNFVDTTPTESTLLQVEGLVQMSLVVYYQDGVHRRYLSSELDTHQAWKSQSVWQLMLQNSINRRIDNHVKEKPPQQQQQQYTLQTYAAGGLKAGLSLASRFTKGFGVNLTASA